MLLILLALQITQHTEADSVLAATRKAVAPVADTAAARANGFVPLLQLRINDRLPFQGEHWVNRQRLLRDTSVDIHLAEPAIVMFAPVDGNLRRVGAAYITRLPQGFAGPTGLGGDAGAAWHSHLVCRNVPGEVSNVLADDVDDCRARGGTPTQRKLFMVHVWTDVPNPERIYGQDNPALPFLALSLKPPVTHDLHEPEKAQRIRMLGLAIAETYDARMPLARLVEQSNRDPLLADSLRVLRTAILTEIPALKLADVGGNQLDYNRISLKMIAHWQAIADLYKRMAPTPVLRTLVTKELETVSTHSHH